MSPAHSRRDKRQVGGGRPRREALRGELRVRHPPDPGRVHAHAPLGGGRGRARQRRDAGRPGRGAAELASRTVVEEGALVGAFEALVGARAGDAAGRAGRVETHRPRAGTLPRHEIDPDDRGRDGAQGAGRRVPAERQDPHRDDLLVAPAAALAQLGGQGRPRGGSVVEGLIAPEVAGRGEALAVGPERRPADRLGLAAVGSGDRDQRLLEDPDDCLGAVGHADQAAGRREGRVPLALGAAAQGRGVDAEEAALGPVDRLQAVRRQREAQGHARGVRGDDGQPAPRGGGGRRGRRPAGEDGGQDDRQSESGETRRGHVAESPQGWRKPIERRGIGR